MSGNEMSDLEVEDLCAWIDEFPLSRPKKNLAKDFADGVMVAEIIKHFDQRIIKIGDYPRVNNTEAKIDNWKQLNRKVLKKLGVGVTDSEIKSIITYQSGAIENFLWRLRIKLFRMEWDRKSFQTPRSKANTERKEVVKAETEEPTGSPRGKTTQLSLESKRSVDSKRGNFYDYMSPSTELMYKYHLHRSELPVIPVAKGNRYMGELNYITRLVYEQKEKEGQSLDRNIAFLESKISRLQHLHYIKDMHIEEAERRLKRESLGYLYSPYYHDKYIRY